MVQFDNQYRQIKIKVVYYGPAVGGKTTCLQQIHRITDPERRSKLYSLNTASDRTLFFDLLSLNLGRIRGFRLTLQLYTVPGQVQYDATRRAVLTGADGVVFVADSQLHQKDANVESLENLWQNMTATGLDRETVPVVLQYNKRDLEDIQTVEEMDAALNKEQQPAFETVAITGDGVLDAFAVIAERTLAAVADKLGVGTNTQAVERLQQQMRTAIQPFMEEGKEPPPADDVEIHTPAQDVGASEVLSEEMLVAEAVRANVTMTDLNTRLENLSRQLQRKVRVMDRVSDFGTAVSNARDPAKVLRLLIINAIRLLQVQGAAVLIVPGSGLLREAVVHGFRKDPLLSSADETGQSAAAALLDEKKPELVAPGNDDDDESTLLSVVRKSDFASAIAIPLVTQDKVVGLLTAYGDNERAILDEDDLQLAMVLASTAAMGYANAIAWKQMQEFSKGLETQVEERTAELRSTLGESRRLSADLAEKNSLLDTAYRELEALDEVKNQLINRLSLDLRTPVTSLFTAAKILQRETDAPAETTSRLLTVVYDEAEKLLEIIQSICQASVLSSPASDLKPRPVNAQNFFRKAIAPLRDLAKERQVAVHVLIPTGFESICCEPESSEAALRAVIKNGIEFNHPGGDVKLEVRRVLRGEEPWLHLRVADTGTGISEENLPQVCEAFYQGDDSQAGKRHGIGLGLAIAKRVMENHGGSITINSSATDGTEVIMAIPQTEG